jgi:hypothetical protein
MNDHWLYVWEHFTHIHLSEHHLALHTGKHIASFKFQFHEKFQNFVLIYFWELHIILEDKYFIYTYVFV